MNSKKKSRPATIFQILVQKIFGKGEKRQSILLIEIQKAFDSVDRSKFLDIIDRITKTTIERQLVEIIRILHENIEVIFNNEVMTISYGVP